MEKRLKRPFEPPSQGSLEFSFQYENSIPGIQHRASSIAVNALKVRLEVCGAIRAARVATVTRTLWTGCLQEIVTSATSDQDRINWLRLLLKDQYLTTDQGQDILDHLADAGLIGTGAMQKTEIFIACVPPSA